MKKLLTALAVVAFASNAYAGDNSGFGKATGDMKEAGEKLENSYKEVPNPLRPFAGVLVSPLGNTIQYTAEGLDILKEVGYDQAVTAIVNSGQCIKESTHPGVLTGCVVKLGGDGMIVIWTTVGYSAGNVVDFGGEALSDIAYIVRDAAKDLAGAAERANVPLVSPLVQGGATVVSFVMNAAGVIVEVTASTLADGIRGLADGGALTISEAVNVPVQLLNLKPSKAAQSFAIALGAAGCTVVDVAITTPIRLVMGLLNAIDQGGRKLESCLSRASKDFEAIRNGTYVPPANQDDMYRH